MRLSALSLAAFVLLLAGGTAASVGKTPPAPAQLLAYESGGGGLVRVDPLTLRPRGEPLVTASPASWAYSPDGRSLLVYDANRPPELVDLRGWRSLGRFPALGGWSETFLWAEPDRVVALVRAETARVVVLDPQRLRIRSRTRLAGGVAAVARGSGHVAVLAGPQGRIGPSRLHLVDRFGRVRTVELARVRSGFAAAPDGTGRRVTPALVLDPAGRRAVVIQPAGPAAEVDLATLRVRYRELRRARSLAARLHDWLEPQAHAKQMTGPELWGRPVGERAVAVASWEHVGISKRDGEQRALVRSHGVFVVDTRSWTRRTLSETASGVATTGDVALVYAGPFAPGRPFGADEGATPGGVEAFGPDGKRRYRLFGSRAVGFVQAAGAYAYVRVSPRAWDVVDARTGRVLRRARTAHELTLLPRD